MWGDLGASGSSTFSKVGFSRGRVAPVSGPKEATTIRFTNYNHATKTEIDLLNKAVSLFVNAIISSQYYIGINERRQIQIKTYDW